METAAGSKQGQRQGQQTTAKAKVVEDLTTSAGDANVEEEGRFQAEELVFYVHISTHSTTSAFPCIMQAHSLSLRGARCLTSVPDSRHLTA